MPNRGKVKPKLRTVAQNSLMFGLAARAGVSHDDLRDWTAEITNGRTEHTSELYFAECVQIIDRLQSFVNSNSSKATPRRTIQYRRRQAGVEQIVTQEHLDKMRREWFAVEGRTESGLESLSVRQCKNYPPRTTKECNSIIEAIKSMNQRDRTFGAFKKQEAA